MHTTVFHPVPVAKMMATFDHIASGRAGLNIEDCVSDPKPLRSPRPPLVCAGISDIGRKFSIEEADACLISSHGQEGLKDLSVHVHDIARDLGKKTNTIALIMVVPGRTNSE